MKWTCKEIIYLKENYTSETKEIISKTLKREWSSIQAKASVLNLKRDNSVSYSKNHLRKLLEDTSNDKFYWLGFLLADGHFSEKTLSVEIANKDLEHLEKFKKYLGVNINIFNRKNRECSSLNITDSYIKYK